jgi:hypothetical protein
MNGTQNVRFYCWLPIQTRHYNIIKVVHKAGFSVAAVHIVDLDGHPSLRYTAALSLVFTPGVC